MEWLHRAACLKEDPDLFFPVGEAGPARDQVEVARRVCARCEVRESCLAWALETGVADGVLGGLTGVERRALRRPSRVKLGLDQGAGFLQPVAEIGARKGASRAGRGEGVPGVEERYARRVGSP